MRPARVPARWALALLFFFAAFAPGLTFAQDGTPEATVTGTLTIVVAECASGGTPGSVLLAPWSGASTGGDCVAATATIDVDGGSSSVAGSLSLTVDAGSHTVTDVATGQSIAIEVPADGEAVVERVAYTAAPPTKAPPAEPTLEAQADSYTLDVRVRLCAPSVEDELDAEFWTPGVARLISSRKRTTPSVQAVWSQSGGAKEVTPVDLMRSWSGTPTRSPSVKRERRTSRRRMPVFLATAAGTALLPIP